MKRANLNAEKKTRHQSRKTEPQEPLNIAALESVQENLFSLVDDLVIRAGKGDSDAFFFLIKCSVALSQAVRQASDTNFQLACKYARHLPAWPVLLFPSPTLNSGHKLLIEKLELGAEFSMPIDLKRAFREATNPRKIAVFLIQMTEEFRLLAHSVMEEIERKSANENPVSMACKITLSKDTQNSASIIKSQKKDRRRMKSIQIWLGLLADVLEIQFPITDLDSSLLGKASLLPPLTRDTVIIWATFGREIIHSMTSQRPENNPVLRKIGTYRKNAYYRKDTTTSTFQDRKKNAKNTEESNIRDGIFTRIEAAYSKVIKNRGGKRIVSKTSRSKRS